MADLNLFFFTVKERIGILFCAADFLVYLTSKWTLFNYLKKPTTSKAIGAVVNTVATQK